MGQRKIQQFARLRRCRMSIVLMHVPGAVRRHVRASAEHWETAFQIAAEHQDIEKVGAARAGTGLAALGMGNLNKAEERFRQARPLTEHAGDVWMTSLIHVWLGTILLVRGDPTAATAEIGRGLELGRGGPDPTRNHGEQVLRLLPARRITP